MTIKGLQELVYHFQPDREERPIILLGAGASFRAGVPVVKGSPIKAGVS
jgi:hypothetical protein